MTSSLVLTVGSNQRTQLFVRLSARAVQQTNQKRSQSRRREHLIVVCGQRLEELKADVAVQGFGGYGGRGRRGGARDAHNNEGRDRDTKEIHFALDFVSDFRVFYREKGFCFLFGLRLENGFK